jgi:hypothetical protein
MKFLPLFFGLFCFCDRCDHLAIWRNCGTSLRYDTTVFPIRDRIFVLFVLILICHVLERSGSSRTSWRAPTASGLWDTRMWTVIPSIIPMLGDITPLLLYTTLKCPIIFYHLLNYFNSVACKCNDSYCFPQYGYGILLLSCHVT